MPIYPLFIEKSIKTYNQIRSCWTGEEVLAPKTEKEDCSCFEIFGIGNFFDHIVSWVAPDFLSQNLRSQYGKTTADYGSLTATRYAACSSSDDEGFSDSDVSVESVPSTANFSIIEDSFDGHLIKDQKDDSTEVCNDLHKQEILELLKVELNPQACLNMMESCKIQIQKALIAQDQPLADHVGRIHRLLHGQMTSMDEAAVATFHRRREEANAWKQAALNYEIAANFLKAKRFNAANRYIEVGAAFAEAAGCLARLADQENEFYYSSKDQTIAANLKNFDFSQVGSVDQYAQLIAPYASANAKHYIKSCETQSQLIDQYRQALARGGAKG